MQVAHVLDVKVADFADIFTGRLISEIPLALAAICDALVENSSLVELNLSDNAFGGRSVDPIIPFLTRNRSFQVLKLNNNGLGPAGGAALAGALLESATRNKAEGKTSNLRTVICGRNRLEDGSASAWADAFAAHETLVEVRMPQNGFRMQGVTALARGLSKCLGLQHLDFQDNTFTEDGSLTGIKAWTEALPLWPELLTLNFSDCILSSDGEVPLIISALSEGSNRKLRTLQLQNNNLEAQSFGVLSKGISEHLANLMVLELQWNETDDDETGNLETLAMALKQRGGKVLISDEDEEEEEEEEEEEKEKSSLEEDKVAENEKVGAKVDADADVDALADQLGKVKVG
jgi:Ran GTPase-activating protein 1